MKSVLIIAALVAGIAGLVVPAQAEDGSCIYVGNSSESKIYIMKFPREAAEIVWTIGPKYYEYLKKQNGEYLKVFRSSIMEVSVNGGQFVKVPLNRIMTDVATIFWSNGTKDVPSKCADGPIVLVALVNN